MNVERVGAARVGFVVVLLLAIAATASAQDTVDVVYLTNGSIIRGTITEEEKFPEPQITIETADGSVFVIKKDDIERITTERRGTKGRDASAGIDAPMSDQSLEINLLGLLQFGPYVRYHIGIGGEQFISPHIRVGYLGGIYYILDWFPEIGVGVSYLAYWPMGMGAARFYAGGLTEVTVLNYDDPAGINDVAVAGNFGVRWRIPDATSFWQTGIIAGVGYDFWWEEITFFGMLELSWGWEL
jgi:hypothetical protein